MDVRLVAPTGGCFPLDDSPPPQSYTLSLHNDLSIANLLLKTYHSIKNLCSGQDIWVLGGIWGGTFALWMLSWLRIRVPGIGGALVPYGWSSGCA